MTDSAGLRVAAESAAALLLAIKLKDGNAQKVF
jgi:hypothetical protein